MRHIRTFFVLFFSVLLLSGCASFFGTGIPSDPRGRLTYDIDAVLADPIFRSTMPSVKVVDPENGEVLYERNSEAYIRPASNMKLLTSSAALHVLGPQYLFKTSLSWDPPDDSMTIRGNVYLKGYGDPDLSTADIDSLAAWFAATGVAHVRGDVVVDASFFDSLQWGVGWMWDDEPAPYQAYVSALSVNKNSIFVTASYDTSIGMPQAVTDPVTSFVTVKDFATVAEDSVTERIDISRPASEEPNTIVVKGQMMMEDEPYEDQLTVLWPDLYAGTLLKESLARHGVDIDGSVLPGVVPDSVSEMIWNVRGMDSVVVNLNKVSDNLSAEMLLKTLSATIFGPPGNTRGGRSVVNAFLDHLGIDTLRHRMVDGSGLSHYSLLRVDLLTDLLVRMYRQDDIFPLFYASLPIGGVDGTIENRMIATRAEGNVHAKTGTISGVSSLSGYVTTRDGNMLVFGMTMQDFIGSSSPYRYAQDRICEILANYSRERVFANE